MKKILLTTLLFTQTIFAASSVIRAKGIVLTPATLPTYPASGEIRIDSAAGDAVKRYSGGSWATLHTGTIAIGSGGTGQTSATAAFDALAPTTTQGDIIYFNGTDNVRLGAGTSGYALTTQGAGANPIWSSVLTNPMDSAGDMIVGGVAGAPAKLDSGTAGQILVSAGAASPAWGTQHLGTSTNDSASAGYVGEHVESVVGLTSFPTSLQYGDLTSISLTAGDWDVSANIETQLIATTINYINFGISTTPGNFSTGLTKGSNFLNIVPPTATYDSGNSIASYRMSLSGTTTVYLKYLSSYTSTAPKAAGRLSARRVR